MLHLMSARFQTITQRFEMSLHWLKPSLYGLIHHTHNHHGLLWSVAHLRLSIHHCLLGYCQRSLDHYITSLESWTQIAVCWLLFGLLLVDSTDITKCFHTVPFYQPRSIQINTLPESTVTDRSTILKQNITKQCAYFIEYIEYFHHFFMLDFSNQHCAMIPFGGCIYIPLIPLTVRITAN